MSKRIDKAKIFYIIMTFIIALVIFLASSITSFPIIEKTGIDLSIFYHFGVFFMLTFFLTLSLINRKISNKTIIIILLISIIYALFDEVHQLFVPGRFCNIKDMSIDFAGSLVSVLVIKIIEKLKRI
jgi:VanZ family protein